MRATQTATKSWYSRKLSAPRRKKRLNNMIFSASISLTRRENNACASQVSQMHRVVVLSSWPRHH